MASHVEAVQEKRSAALSSVVAAVGLTTMKLIVGLLTGSLGILSEAAHSGLDLVAALVTLFAVQTSDKPADDNHHFGHGKIENVSALVETLLLLATCAWIIYEAIQRLFFKQVHVEASIWAFLIMGVSIVVDFTRSRILKQAADKHKSQALEADALHFSTDIWSSSVVILGLVGIKLAEWFPGLKFLAAADAVAALGVSLIVIYVSLQLGRRSIEALLDTAPQGLAEKITRAVAAMPEIEDIHQIRVLPSGANMFIEAHVYLKGTTSLEETHVLMDKVENVIRSIVPDADVTIHPEPLAATHRTTG
ncbi:MAG: cation diffusion facilitator family transporter [Anaerolineaceae bacterium]